MSIIARDAPNWMAMLTIVLLLIRGMGKQYKTFRDDQTWSRTYATKALEALDKFSETIIQNQAIILRTIQDTGKEGNDKFLYAVGELCASSHAASAEIILALSEREKNTVKAIEALLISLREDLATARATPPAGSTGSQVRDSGKGSGP